MKHPWHWHPGVRTGPSLTFGERAADRMKAVFATWTALLAILSVMGAWLVTGGFGADPKPFILLNLCLSCLAALQCFILLIAARRADQISAEAAEHHYREGAQMSELLAQNTALTEEVHTLAQALHDHLIGS